MIQTTPSILVHARIRLSTEERDAFKDSYYQFRNAIQPSSTEAATPNGGFLQVETATNIDHILSKRLGMSNIVVTDLLNSRESVSLPVVLQLQAILGVEVVSKDRYMEAAESYFEFITSKVEASNS